MGMLGSNAGGVFHVIPSLGVIFQVLTEIRGSG